MASKTARVHPHPNPNPESRPPPSGAALPFEGALRPITVFNIAKRRGQQSFRSCARKEPSLLREFLSYFPVLMSFVGRGDPDGIVQLAVDFIEDCQEQRRTRCVHREQLSRHKDSFITAEDGLQAVLRGFELGSKRFGVKKFCDENPPPGQSLRQSRRCRHRRGPATTKRTTTQRASGTHPDIVRLFQEAYKAGIHRTAHAGENSGAEMRILHDRVHLETCPLSSHLTSAVLTDWPHHPIHRLAADKANYSINTDDPTFTGQCSTRNTGCAWTRIGLPPLELVRTKLLRREVQLPAGRGESRPHRSTGRAYYRVRL
uniref:Adenosine deaminase n=1 Tax=Macrostomum lignano TaxID=282301 RepID=A0A1I8F7U9_9PLAT